MEKVEASVSRGKIRIKVDRERVIMQYRELLEQKSK